MNDGSPVYEAIARYKAYLSPEDYERLLLSATEPAPSAVRMNYLKTDDPSGELTKLSNRYGWSVKPLAFHPDAVSIESSVTSPGQTLEHRMGQYYVQDAASILPVSLFSAKKAPRLTLDMAASPGGKTTQLIDSTFDRGFVMANDSSASRLPALKTVLTLWGAANVAITNFSGEKLGDWLPEIFDRVLLDAPCSMEGLRDSTSHPFRSVTEGERNRLADRQVALLESAIKATKVGGEIVYSTCTLAPEEDEMVVDRVLKRYPGAIEVVHQPDFACTSGLTSFEAKELLPDLKNSIRVWPFSFGTNGFFAVKLIKKQLLPIATSNMPTRPFTSTGFVRLRSEDENRLHNLLTDRLGLDFASLFAELGLYLYERQGQIYLLPQAWVEHFATLPYYSLGMQIGKQIKDTFEPSIELINRWNHLIKVRNWQIPDEFVSAWLRGGDLRGSQFEGAPERGVVIIRDREGRYLGAGKVIPGRIRNLLPNRNLLQ
ncbi:MAG: hypothetical protein WBI14_00405 [Anaerolineaceae bacterium]